MPWTVDHQDGCLGIKVVLDCPKPSIFYTAAFGFGKWLACVASVSVRFRSKERGTRVKNPVSRSFFAPKLNRETLATQASKWLICAAATVPCWLRTNCAQASTKIVYIHKSKAMHVPRDSRLKETTGSWDENRTKQPLFSLLRMGRPTIAQ